MVADKEFFNVKYQGGSLDAKTAQLIHFAVSLAIGYEFGAKHPLTKARVPQKTKSKRLSYTMRPAAAKVRNFGNRLIGE